MCARAAEAGEYRLASAGTDSRAEGTEPPWRGFRTGHGVQKLTPRKLSLDGEGKAAWWRHLAQKGGAERLRGAGRPLSLGRGCGHT